MTNCDRRTVCDLHTRTARRTRIELQHHRRDVTASAASVGPSIPHDRIQAFERIYPFGWLGMLIDTPPDGRRADLRRTACAVLRSARCAR